ncbi:MAG: DUF2171 domain-containing protein [Thermomicrobiales bacterium]
METEEIVAGAEVVDAEGEHLGNVIAATDEYVVAEQGFFFPTDHYIPRQAIAKVEDATVWLSIRKHDVLAQGWSVQPDADAETARLSTSGQD